MSHREKSMHPWIKNATEPRPAKYRDFTVEQINTEAQRADITDEDKHAICMIRTGHRCAVLSPSMYDAAVVQGCDMASFVKNKPMPVEDTVRGLRRLLGDDMRPVSDMLRGPKKHHGRKRKNRDSVSCHDCMPGLNGNCTCCTDKE